MINDYNNRVKAFNAIVLNIVTAYNYDRDNKIENPVYEIQGSSNSLWINVYDFVPKGLRLEIEQAFKAHFQQ